VGEWGVIVYRYDDDGNIVEGWNTIICRWGVGGEGSIPITPLIHHP
jgi:hypothetical protein